jgi:hypothetical protein
MGEDKSGLLKARRIRVKGGMLEIERIPATWGEIVITYHVRKDAFNEFTFSPTLSPELIDLWIKQCCYGDVQATLRARYGKATEQPKRRAGRPPESEYQRFARVLRERPIFLEKLLRGVDMIEPMGRRSRKSRRKKRISDESMSDYLGIPESTFRDQIENVELSETWEFIKRNTD